MVNQRGQAFSVFELMIAGVVAFAILIILLMVIGGVGTQAYSDPKTVIANAIKTASPSGGAGTSDFILTKQAPSVDNQDLSIKTDLDASSIYFVLGAFKEGESLIVDEANASVTYTGSTQKKLSAQVVCAQTGTDLDAKLGRVDPDGKFTLAASDAATTCGDAQPCCFVILMRPSK